MSNSQMGLVGPMDLACKQDGAEVFFFQLGLDLTQSEAQEVGLPCVTWSGTRGGWLLSLNATKKEKKVFTPVFVAV